jgi:hypothetical protein
MTGDNRDPFALARAEGGTDDAELFELITEYQRREERANESEIDDEERDRRCDHARVIRDRIEEIRPATLRGVLAALDLGSEITDPAYWPDEAIEGLRAVVGGARAGADTELLAAERRLTALHQERKQCMDGSDRCEALGDELWQLHQADLPDRACDPGRRPESATTRLFWKLPATESESLGGRCSQSRSRPGSQ